MSYFDYCNFPLCIYAFLPCLGNEEMAQEDKAARSWLWISFLIHTTWLLVYSWLLWGYKPCIYNRWILLSHILIEVLCISGVILLFLIICSTTALKCVGVSICITAPTFCFQNVGKSLKQLCSYDTKTKETLKVGKQSNATNEKQQLKFDELYRIFFSIFGNT